MKLADRVLLFLCLLLLLCSPVLVQAADESRPEDRAYRDLALFTDVYALIKNYYVEQPDSADLIQAAIDGMLASLDPHSSFLTAAMYQQMEIETQGEFGGLGLEISIRDNRLLVVAPLAETPAAAAGIEPGDQIVAIDGEATANMNLMDAVERLRGAAGDAVRLSLRRKDEEEIRELTVVREIIQLESVKSRWLEEGLASVRILQFQDRTASDLRQQLQRLHQQGPLNGLILDLRNNPGGLLEQAVAVADQFLAEGLIVYTEGRDPQSRIELMATPGGTEPDYPLVVLINAGSASAAEIVAGALQDSRRALIAGEQSFGKGSVQTLVPLSDGAALRLTTARYFTPSGRSIQARGIRPDIQIKAAQQGTQAAGERLRESDLVNHFSATEDSAAQEGSDHESRDAKQDDQLDRALELLRVYQRFAADAPAAL